MTPSPSPWIPMGVQQSNAADGSTQLFSYVRVDSDLRMGVILGVTVHGLYPRWVRSSPPGRCTNGTSFQSEHPSHPFLCRQRPAPRPSQEKVTQP